MNNIGILAYGSLIRNQGEEIKNVTANIIENVKTSFKVEFARKSKRRNGSPTLVTFEEGGAFFIAKIIVLKQDVSGVEAQSMLYRREINKVGSNKKYVSVSKPGLVF